MGSSIVETGDWAISVPSVDTGEPATEDLFDAVTQALTDRTKYLKTLTEATGVKRIRTVTNLAAMQAIDDQVAGDIVVVNQLSTGATGIYQFRASGGPPDDSSPIMVPALAGPAGYWDMIGAGRHVGNVANGFARLNGSSKVTTQYQANAVLKSEYTEMGGSDYSSTSTGTVTNLSLDLSTLATGDIVHLDGQLLARADGSSGYARFELRMNSTAVTRALLEHTGTATDDYRMVPLVGGRFVVPSGGNYIATVEVVAIPSGGGVIVSRLYAGATHLRALVIRP